jgi:tetratricopeptide (TPR) repeat protein
MEQGSGLADTNSIAQSTNAPKTAAQRFFERYGINRPGPNDTNTVAQSTNSPSAAETNDLSRLLKKSDQETKTPATEFAPPHHSNLPNYWKLTQEARDDLTDKKWAEAKAPLNTLISLYPAQSGPDNPYAMLATAQRALNETNDERQTLTRLAAIQDDAIDAYLRLMQLDEARRDWPAVAENAERYLAVNPLIAQPYRYLARASEALGRPIPAIRSYQRLLLLDPPDPADTHFRLAGQLRGQGNLGGAKRQVLEALEEAPRFRDAQRLLLDLEDHPRTNQSPAAVSFPAPPPPAPPKP